VNILIQSLTKKIGSVCTVTAIEPLSEPRYVNKQMA